MKRRVVIRVVRPVKFVMTGCAGRVRVKGMMIAVRIRRVVTVFVHRQRHVRTGMFLKIVRV